MILDPAEGWSDGRHIRKEDGQGDQVQHQLPRHTHLRGQGQAALCGGHIASYRGGFYMRPSKCSVSGKGVLTRILIGPQGGSRFQVF